VLVALERNTIRGFAVTGPAADPDCDAVADGEITELTVDPEQTRHGHGSRLIQACADTLRADRFTRAVTWVNSTNDTLRGFLGEAGWAPDGAHRELDLHGDGSVTVKQVRLHTDLSEVSDSHV
jgi:GNAT superfamily N-acetyltransferase